MTPMRWAPIRAGLIALAIVVSVMEGCPVPAASERPVMERRLPHGAVKAVDEMDHVRGQLLRPFSKLFEITRVHQRWKLFAGASRKRYRMRIEARAGATAEWQLVYRVLDDDHAFMAGAIEYRRMRGAWNPHSTHGPRGGYGPFVQWVAQRVLASNPAFTEVRVQHERILIGPHGGYRATGEMLYPVVVTR
jgi:hypothetical protein